MDLIAYMALGFMMTTIIFGYLSVAAFYRMKLVNAASVLLKITYISIIAGGFLLTFFSIVIVGRVLKVLEPHSIVEGVLLFITFFACSFIAWNIQKENTNNKKHGK